MTTLKDREPAPAEATIPDAGPEVELFRFPASAATLEGFRHWATSDACSRRWRVSHLSGELFCDMSPEELETHNKVKSAISHAIFGLNEELGLGTFYSDRTLLTNVAAGISTEPDALLVSWDAFRSGRVRAVSRSRQPGRVSELEGAPDWVLEVVSLGSVAKDTQVLREAYARAGVGEYWLVNALGDEVSLQVMTAPVGGQATASGYRVMEARGGWHPSTLFRRSFRLERGRDPVGMWRYKLHAKTD